MTDEDEVRERFVREVRELTSADDPWTGMGTVSYNLEKEGIPGNATERAKDELETESRVLGWHGLITVSESERLREINRRESEADVTRGLLVKKVNRHLKDIKEREDSDDDE